MNEVSIIIKGVRYDAVYEEGASCHQCVLQCDCNDYTYESLCYSLVPMCVFKKSDKKFEI